jgi:hypothetical protein
VNPGFNPHCLPSFDVSLSRSLGKNPSTSRSAIRELDERLKEVRGCRKQAQFRDPQVTLDNGKRKEHMELLTTVPLLIIDDLGMRKLGPTAGEEMLEIVMRRYERASTVVTSNRPVEDWGKLLGDSAAVTAMLDRLLHHGHILKCGPRSWRTKTGLPDQEKTG